MAIEVPGLSIGPVNCGKAFEGMRDLVIQAFDIGSGDVAKKKGVSN